MPRVYEGPVDYELLMKYVVPALNTIGALNRAEWPGRATTCELAALHIRDLIARDAENRTLLMQLGYGTRRRVTSKDCDTSGTDWLEAMEREHDEMQHGVKVNQLFRKDAPPYLCSECGEPIEAGDYVGANAKGVIHVECAEQPQQF